MAFGKLFASKHVPVTKQCNLEPASAMFQPHVCSLATLADVWLRAMETDIINIPWDYVI